MARWCLAAFFTVWSVEIHHLLVVAVHEVDLHPGDAPLLVERERLVHLRLDAVPAGPQQDLQVALARQLHEARDVNIPSRAG